MTSILPSARPLAALLLATAAGAASANDFPTVERVLYVQECVATHPGPQYEMVNKCACAVDALARDLKFDDYVTLSTAAKATSIGGERGSYIREAPAMQKDIKRYKELQTKAEKSCFLSAAVPR
ncbi:hypothetical protein [Aquincola sp. J276]|uniref:hypothetical protein n=1 Tax=Aquincola sp. J276 TaxID=2898432 RepID=UPI002151D665|nr:hypothetical protein [Aquincola sp. J276]MCR5868845.1 hypothetical protein [Aquincola sp. J276]